MISNEVGYFQVLRAESMKMSVYSDIPQYSLVEIGRRFRGAVFQELIVY
jgi:hypothetical protein